MSLSAKEKLEKLKKQKLQLDARISKIENAHKAKERKIDTRRKILVGSYYLEKAIKEDKMADLKKELATFLTRNSDKALFGIEINKG